MKDHSRRLHEAVQSLTPEGVAVGLREAEEANQSGAFLSFMAKRYEFPAVPFVLAYSIKAHLYALIESGLAEKFIHTLPHGYGYKLTREGNTMVDDLLFRFEQQVKA